MPKFKGTEARIFTIAAPIEEVTAMMCDPARFSAYFADLERSEKVDDTTHRWVLDAKNEKGVRFKGDYTVQYDFNGSDKMSWKTVSDGNMTSDGVVTFSSQGSNTRVDYSETIVCDMDVNRILARVIKPIVDREIAKGVGGYLDRVKAGIES